MHLRILTAVLIAFATSSHAQERGAEIAPWKHAHGLAQCDGHVAAAGPGYKASLSRDGIAFTPALGDAVRENQVLHLSARGVLRGGERWELSRSDFAIDGERAIRALSPSVVEQVESRAEGLEHSFLLHALPAGGGDLVIELALDTNLPRPAAGSSPHGVSYRSAETGGVRIGAVTGIAADGVRCGGALRWSDGALELVLPAAFVDTAALPLLVDPLISGEFAVGGSTNADVDPDAAYNAFADTYLVVWERRFSAADTDVIAARLTSGGAWLAPIYMFEFSTSVVGLDPTVCNVAGSQRFLIVWRRGTSMLDACDLEMAAVPAGGSSGQGQILGPVVVPVAGGALDPDAGGVTGSGTSVLVVYAEQDAGIRCMRVSAPSAAIPSVLSTTTLSTAPTAVRPAITKSGGSAGRWLATWQQFFTLPAPGDHDLRYVLLDGTGAAVSPVTVEETLGIDETLPDVDGDGASFYLAWSVQDVGDGQTDRRIEHRKITLSAPSTLVPAAIVPLTTTGDARSPAVAFCGPKYAVAWAQQDSFLDYRIRVSFRDPQDCDACETLIDLETDSDTPGSLELAPMFAAGSTSDAALLAWDSLDAAPPFAGGIRAQRVEALGAGGAFTDLGGACNTPGKLGFNGPVAIGNTSFAVTLTDAPPTAIVAILTIAPAFTAPIACQGCAVLPFAPLIFVKNVVGGQASLPLAIPCDMTLNGAQLDMQWSAIPGPAVGCELFAQFSFTQIRRTAIGF